jgi:hypothetical protein
MNDLCRQPRKHSTATLVCAARSRLSTINYQLSTHARAFTFIEVLFAIIILGVGLIMIAGMLPVAIQQGQKSQEDLNGRVVCDNGYAVLRARMESEDRANSPTKLGPKSVPGASDFSVPPTYPFAPMVYGADSGAAAGNFWDLIQNDRISTVDPRFAWVPFWQREEGSSRVNLIVLSIRRVNSDVELTPPQYSDRYTNGVLNQPDSEPQAIKATIVEGLRDSTGAEVSRVNSAFVGVSGPSITLPAGEPVGRDYILFRDPATASSNAPDNVAEGTFVIVAYTPVAPSGATEPARNNGRVFRIGTQVLDGDRRLWTLDPAYSLAELANGIDDSLADPTRPPTVYVVGRGLQNPYQMVGSGNGYVGPAQDVAVERYSFTIR